MTAITSRIAALDAADAKEARRRERLERIADRAADAVLALAAATRADPFKTAQTVAIEMYARVAVGCGLAEGETPGQTIEQIRKREAARAYRRRAKERDSR